MAERQLIDRIAGGDAAAHSRALALYAGAEPGVRTELLNRLAAAAPRSPHVLELLLRLVDEHALDRGAIRRVLVDDDAADDAHQDVLIVVAQSIDRFRGESAFTTWLHSVARNVAVDLLRRRRETVGYDADLEAPSEAARLSSLIATRSDLAAAVDDLPDAYRATVILRDIEQRTYAEIAEALGLEMNTVKSRLSRGRALVAAMMAERVRTDDDDG